MRVLHIIEGLGGEAGGPSRSVQGLVVSLSQLGVDAHLATLCKGAHPWVDGVWDFAELSGGVGEFREYLRSISPDVVHIHGLWRLRLHGVASICKKFNVPYIIAPRGMLEPWSLQQKWLKKRIARWLYQDKDLKCAAALHATAESEAEQFRKLGFKNPIIISPNGVNVPMNGERGMGNGERKSGEKRRVLFVSRMHPKKGVMELVEAWGRLVVSRQSSVVSGWECELVYTVSGELEKEYEAKVKARVKELGIEDQFIFTGALNDDEKWGAYARADLFVLPTYSENFGIVVAEALWAGVPVITTKGTPWYELEGYANSQLTTLNSKLKCGWWIDTGVELLVKALGEATALSDVERREMGARGRKLVEEKYTWDAVVKAMVKGYEDVLGVK